MANPVVKHLKVSGKPAGPDPHRIYGSDWDDEHVIEGFDDAVAGTIPANIVSQQDAEEAANNTGIMSPLRTKQQIDARLADEATAEAGADASGLMTPLTSNQQATKRFGSVGVVDLTQPPYNLSMSTPDVDQSDIINQAFIDFEGCGVELVIPAFSDDTIEIGISSTIEFKRGVTLRGGNGYGGNRQSDADYTGAIIKWIGSDNSTMIEMKGVNHCAFYGIKLDGNGASGITGIHLWSENNPPQSYNIAKHFTIKGCFKSIVLSDPGDTSYAPVGTDPANVGRAQNDNILIEDFTIFGDGTEASTGIHVNGTNTGQTSLICRGNIQSVDYGVRMIQNNGTLKFMHIVGGNLSGSHKVVFRYEASLFVPPTLEQCETEGNATYAIHDSSKAYDDGEGTFFSQYSQVWINNAFNNPILIDGGALILSIGNSGGSPLAEGFEWVVGGTAQVWSMMDTNPLVDGYASPWQTTGSGQVSVMGARGRIAGVYTGQVSAGAMVPVADFPPGAISSSISDNDGDAGRYYLGNTGDRYLNQIGTLAYLAAMSLSVGGAPGGSPDIGDIVSVGGTATGRFLYGSDMAVLSFRDGNDVKFTLGTGGVLYVNNAALNPEGFPIGATTPSTGKFTTLQATTSLTSPAATITTLTPTNIVGTTTNNNASTGSVGEYVSSSVAFGSAVSLTTNTAKTITSISLTAGDWDVSAIGHCFPANTTSMTKWSVSISTTTNTADNTPGRVVANFSSATVFDGANAIAQGVPPGRFSLSTTTTLYLVITATFTASTCVGFGIIQARRVR